MRSMAEQETRPCPSCEGSGEEFDHDAGGGFVTDCRDCHGSGKVPYKGTKKAPAAPPAPVVPQPQPPAPADLGSSA